MSAAWLTQVIVRFAKRSVLQFALGPKAERGRRLQGADSAHVFRGAFGFVPAMITEREIAGGDSLIVRRIAFREDLLQDCDAFVE